MPIRAAELGALTAAARTAGSATVLVGEVGSGKTWLLGAVTAALSAGGAKVRRMSGNINERDLPYAGLHQLLSPIAGQLTGPDQVSQHKALLTVLGRGEAGPADPLLIGSAALTALQMDASSAPVVVTVDDAQWLDPDSARVLAFVGRRLADVPISMIVATSGAPPSGLSRDFDVLRIGPLPDSEAADLLDELPEPPFGSVRTAVVEQAAGNPLALTELAAGYAADPGADRLVTIGPLPLTERLADLYPVDLRDQPEVTRGALIALAVADRVDLDADLPPGFVPPYYFAASGVWRPAEQAGIVTTEAGRVRFRHPLLRSAVYHQASDSERAEAHRGWVTALAQLPRRSAWHRAAAAVAPDDEAADALAATLDDDPDEEQHEAVMTALERAAELTSDPERAAQRFLTALKLAEHLIQVGRGRRLAAAALALTRNPAITGDIRRILSRLDGLAGYSEMALSGTLAVVMAGADAPSSAAWAAAAQAASAAYHLGTVVARDRVRAATGAVLWLPGNPAPEESDVALDLAGIRLWVNAGIDPFAGRAEKVADLHRIIRAGPPAGVAVPPGAAAWVLDESAAAVRLFEPLAANEFLSQYANSMLTFGWALLESGRWGKAATVLRQTRQLSRTWGQELIESYARAGLAFAMACREPLAVTMQQAVAALRLIDPVTSRAAAVRAYHAAGLAALGHGDSASAWVQLSRAVIADGKPAHYHASYYALADLAEAAVRSGRPGRGRVLADQAISQLGGEPSPRVRQLIRHAHALLATDADAGDLYREAVADFAGEAWPYERARLLLSYGRWLRRNRSIAESREPLELAAHEFTRLDAQLWVLAARQELRATGVTQPSARGGSALSVLSPTEQEVAQMAARGLSNREIAERLFMSPRTVASHLYHIFPKLDITTRAQLRNIPSLSE